MNLGNKTRICINFCVTLLLWTYTQMASELQTIKILFSCFALKTRLIPKNSAEMCLSQVGIRVRASEIVWKHPAWWKFANVLLWSFFLSSAPRLQKSCCEMKNWLLLCAPVGVCCVLQLRMLMGVVDKKRSWESLYLVARCALKNNQKMLLHGAPPEPKVLTMRSRQSPRWMRQVSHRRVSEKKQLSSQNFQKRQKRAQRTKEKTALKESCSMLTHENLLNTRQK